MKTCHQASKILTEYIYIYTHTDYVQMVAEQTETFQNVFNSCVSC